VRRTTTWSTVICTSDGPLCRKSLGIPVVTFIFSGVRRGVCRCEVWVVAERGSEKQGMEAGSSATSLLSGSQSCLLCVAAPTAVGLDGEGGLRLRQLRHRVILRLDADGAARPPCPRGHSRTKKNCSVSCLQRSRSAPFTEERDRVAVSEPAATIPIWTPGRVPRPRCLRTSKSRPLWPNSSRDGVNLAPDPAEKYRVGRSVALLGGRD
jgi:hypothetical protein